MKNSFLLLSAIALLGFVSCGEDDGNAAGCPDGFEGDNCAEQVNTKFIGTYDVEMYGQLSGSIGGLASITLTQEQKLHQNCYSRYHTGSRGWAR